ncbi:MAG: hypothetical protein WDO16_05455 [Bacteroidota bacterium]
MIALITCIGFLCACTKSIAPGAEDDDSSYIKLSDCADSTFAGETVRLCFDSVVADSRCPKNVICIWQGAAVGKFTFTKLAETHTLTLATITSGPAFRKDTTISGYKIELLDLIPYPETPGSAPPSAEVKAKVKITKL